MGWPGSLPDVPFQQIPLCFKTWDNYSSVNLEYKICWLPPAPRSLCNSSLFSNRPVHKAQGSVAAQTAIQSSSQCWINSSRSRYQENHNTHERLGHKCGQSGFSLPKVNHSSELSSPSFSNKSPPGRAAPFAGEIPAKCWEPRVGGVGNAMGLRDETRNLGREAERRGVAHTHCTQGGAKGERNVPEPFPGNIQNHLWEHCGGVTREGTM